MKPLSRSRRDFIRATALAAGSFPFIGSLTSAVRAAEGDQRKLNWCVVGLGSLSNGQISRAFPKTKYCQLTGIVTGHPDKAARWKEQYNLADKNIYNYDTMDKLVDNPDIDVVYVVTPNALHAEHTIKALKAGKHVYCEKPMEVSVEKCQSMIDAAKSAGKMLGVGYRSQFDPNHLQCFRMGQDKALGALTALEAGFGRTMQTTTEWRLQMALAGGGPMMDVGIYALQSTRHITGLEPIQVSAKEHPKTDLVKFKEVEEGLDWQATFPGGLVANCKTSYNVSQGMNGFQVTAEKGSFGLQPAYGYTGCHGTITDAAGPRPIPAIQGFDEFAAEMDDFAQCIINNKPSKVAGEEGLKDVRIMRAIYESARLGQPVKLA
jgi:predicted dehydrogenase